MVVGLFSSRIVLQVLGVSDYGLYHVVGGLIAMFTFIAGSLAGATTRFINYEMGRKDGNLNRIFNISLTLHVFFALGLFLIVEAAGSWYVINHLNVAPGKEADAMFVFQVSTIIACLGITNVPYQGLFNAFERFSVTACVNITIVLIQFGLVIMLLYVDGNSLRLYSLIMCLSMLLSFITYRVLAFRFWPETVRHRIVRHDPAYREILSFSSYNILGSAAMMARGAGSNLLINSFFGTAVNGAYGVATTVQTYVNSLIGNIDAAAGPQITQNYSAGNKERYTDITCRISRYSIVLSTAAVLALFCDLEGILGLWLKDVPDGAVVFTRLTLLMALVSSTSTGLTLVINACGRIKKTKLVQCILFLLCLPAGYLLFRNGAPSYWIVVLFIVADILLRLYQFYFLKKETGFELGAYLKSVYSRAIPLLIILAAYCLLYRQIRLTGFARIAGFLVSLGVSAVAVWFIGITRNERKRALQFLKKRVG